MKSTRIILADDHAMLRAGVRALLTKIPGASVVGEAGDGREVIEQIRSTHPDVVMLDIAMPGLNGLEALDRIRREHPGVRCIILSMHANEEYVLKAMRSGAAGYLLKNSKPEELQAALESVREGETYLSPGVARHLAEYLQRNGAGDDPLAQLTPRQREILQLIAEGQSTKEMAATLDISSKTVEMHRAQLMERLEIHDVAGLVRYAIRNGLVDPEH